MHPFASVEMVDVLGNRKTIIVKTKILIKFAPCPIYQHGQKAWNSAAIRGNWCNFARLTLGKNPKKKSVCFHASQRVRSQVPNTLVHSQHVSAKVLKPTELRSLVPSLVPYLGEVSHANGPYRRLCVNQKTRCQTGDAFYPVLIGWSRLTAKWVKDIAHQDDTPGR